jgi:4-hydroxy-3-methylbut-2-en-1-yl diphosphate reductase
LKNFVVVNAQEEVRRWEVERIGVICQTTTMAEHAEKLVEAVRRANPQADVKFVDTICLPTKERQRALEELLSRVEVVVVVGGRNSNNTRKLVERCERNGVRAIWVERARELRAEWFDGVDVVGLTAGTSVMEETVEEVRAWLEAAQIPGTNKTTADTESGTVAQILITNFRDTTFGNRGCIKSVARIK